MLRRYIIIIVGTLCAAACLAQTSGTTRFTAAECRGSYALYDASSSPVAIPDSLTPVFINHVGRHGSRYPASSKGITRLTEALDNAVKAKTITPTGRELLALAKAVTAQTAGQWGALDSLGMAEERAIAARMYRSAPALFDGGRVEAISSYAPRSIMSMYTFTHQLARMKNTVEITTSSGRQYSTLLRPFDTDPEYRAYREGETWQQTLSAFRATTVTTEPLRWALGSLEGLTEEEARELAMDEYALVAGAAAAGVGCNATKFFSLEEYNALWQAANMRLYLLYSASTLSTTPADMASPLLLNLIDTMEAAARGDSDMPTVMLRFGHAETLMPLLSLLRLKGCYYMTNYFDTVASRWQDFNIVPMAANLQMMLLRSTTGALYVRVELNGNVVPLLPGSEDTLTPWEKARDYMTRCIPIFYLGN